MSYGEFRDEMLRALYESARSDPTAEFWSFKEIANIYDIQWQPGWLIELQRELLEEGLIRGPSNGQNDEMAIGRLSGSGMRTIEQEYGTLDGVPTLIVKPEEPLVVEGNSDPADNDDDVPENAITTEDGTPIVTEDGDYIVTEDSSPLEGFQGQISSESWTGIVNRLERNPDTVARIKQQISELDREVEALGLSNHERAKVKAITEALTKLVESPEPEWRAIVELLRSPTLAAVLGLAGLVQLTLKIIFGIG